MPASKPAKPAVGKRKPAAPRAAAARPTAGKPKPADNKASSGLGRLFGFGSDDKNAGGGKAGKPNGAKKKTVRQQ
jgi:hypothetical protein